MNKIRLAISEKRRGMGSTAARVLTASVLTVLLVTMTILLRTTHSPTTDDGADADPRSAWLRLHPPRKARYDNELLRRRLLASMTELKPADLIVHVPQLLASLGHSDNQVRSLSLGMLSKLEPDALTDFTEKLAEVLSEDVASTDDDKVREFILRTLVALADIGSLASNSAAVFDCISSKDPTVRLAAAKALALLEPEDLAPYSAEALAVVERLHDAPLAEALIAGWGVKLDSEACKSRAGEDNCQGVLRALEKHVTRPSRR